MWTLLVLCIVIASDGVQGAKRFQTTDGMHQTTNVDARTGEYATDSAVAGAHCGSQFYDRRGSFMSPNYPNPYPSYADCIWYITPGRGIVQLAFPILDIEFHSNCGFDAIYVYDGSSIRSRLLGKVCGKNSTIFNSTGTSLTVRFRSDSSVSLSGFRAEYQVVETSSCRNYCGYQFANCSCSSNCQYRGDCCPDYEVYCSSTSAPATVTGQTSCRYNCGMHLGSCSCTSSCRYQGNCCHDYNYFCPSTAQTVPSTAETEPSTAQTDVSTAQPSCRYNCGHYMGSCSCSSSCQYYGNCCYDYHSHCQGSITTAFTEGQPSCRYNCGQYMGSCSCSSSCRYYGNCCHDYYSHCQGSPTTAPTTGQPSCRYNCGQNMGSCSCSSSCRYNGNCCRDYYSHCQGSPTTAPTTGQPSCRYNCGQNMGSCSCSSSCRYYGNCCHDYYSHCQGSITTAPTTGQPSCRYNCGQYMGSCSCSSSCRYNGNCCRDYYSHCQGSPTTAPTTGQPSCRYNCGQYMGSCSCSSSCRYYGNCCRDYYSHCQGSPTTAPTTGQPSCRYNCGQYMGSCSCSSSCRYNGNCCRDYYSHCQGSPTTAPTTGQPSCRYNCGQNMGSCSCSSSCQYYGNCCRDYYSHCQYTTGMPGTVSPCGGSLFGSGNFSSPNHPNHYYDHAYCVWQLRAAYDQRIILTFTYLQLENCCSCDYISVYDGPSVNSRFLGKVCNNSLSNFYSTSNYLTVLFRTDSSVVGRGFSADFRSSLPPSSGRVDCSSDNMNIVIQRSYLNSLGYDGNSLYLNDPHCRPQVSRYQVVFSFPINTCGNVRKFENGRVVYTNALRAYTSSSGDITRQSHLKINVGCRMEQDSVAQIMYLVRHHNETSITGTGRFNTSMDFYTSSSFYYKVTQVPYEVTLNQNLYVQVDLGRGDSSLVLFLDTCVTSPSPHDFYTRPYYLVRNGCPVDNTYYAHITGIRAYARFTFKAFQFQRATESVYIQCKVLICQASDYNSRCRRGCSKRAARDLGSEHDSQTLVLGPIQLKDPEKKEEETHKQNQA